MKFERSLPENMPRDFRDITLCTQPFPAKQLCEIWVYYIVVLGDDEGNIFRRDLAYNEDLGDNIRIDIIFLTLVQ